MGLHYESVVGAPLEEVFAWHERPGALARLLPPWQPIRVLQEAASLADGEAVLRLPGGVRWVARHSGLDAPRRFDDELVSLPLPWRHEHRFEARGDQLTRVADTVSTPVPARLLVQTFRYRHAQLAGDLAAHRMQRALRGGTTATGTPLTVAVTGSSGLVGSALCAYLSTGGHRVVRLVRRAPRRPDERQWDPGRPDPRSFEGVDAVVHLAGASIAGRFSAAHKRLVRDSRVGPSHELATTVAALAEGPRVLVSASAIGFYGSDGTDRRLEEAEGPGSGFLAELVKDWEEATEPARAAGVRVVHVRTGIVQSARGGSLKLLRPLFTAGLGGPVSPGTQWVSWVGIDDVLDVYGRALVDERLEGAVNAVAPEPVTNREYAATLARVLRRPALLPVPRLGPQLLLGPEGAHELLEASQRVEPAALLRVGHAFRHGALEACLRHELGRLPPTSNRDEVVAGTSPGVS